MQIGGPSARHHMHRDGIGCWFQYDEDEKPCMVFYHMHNARRDVESGRQPVVTKIGLDELYKYDDDGFLERVAREWTVLFRGVYSLFEHVTLGKFVNDCLSYLLHMRPFPEQLREPAPRIEIEQTDDKRFSLTAHGVH